METETVKPPKPLPNTLRKVMPTLVGATKLSQAKKDLGDRKSIWSYSMHARTHRRTPFMIGSEFSVTAEAEAWDGTRLKPLYVFFVFFIIFFFFYYYNNVYLHYSTYKCALR